VKVLFLNPVGEIGGAERVLLDAMLSLRSADPDIDLHLLVGAPGALLDAARAHEIEVTLLPLPQALAAAGDSSLSGGNRLKRGWYLARQALAGLPRLRPYVQTLWRTIDGIDPTLIHSNGIKTHLLAAAGANSGRPVFWHIHDFYSNRMVAARALRWAHRRAAAGIAVSAAVARDAATMRLL
jgi:hypothetical protein